MCIAPLTDEGGAQRGPDQRVSRDGDTIMPDPSVADASAPPRRSTDAQERRRDDHLVGPPRRRAHAAGAWTAPVQPPDRPRLARRSPGAAGERRSGPDLGVEADPDVPGGSMSSSSIETSWMHVPEDLAARRAATSRVSVRSDAGEALCLASRTHVLEVHDPALANIDHRVHPCDCSVPSSS